MCANIPGWEQLTLGEQAHLSMVAKVCTIEDLKATFVQQKIVRDRYKLEPCWTCKSIAQKLGYAI